MNMFLRCKCYFTNNYYSKLLCGHFTFIDRDQFKNEYNEVLKSVSEEEVERILTELEVEQTRRFNLDKTSAQRTEVIKDLYKPLHHHVYTLRREYLASDFINLVTYCKSELATREGLIEKIQSWPADQVYSFPVFTDHFCQQILEELDHFQASGLPVGKPNTMNNYGVLLDELGFDEGFITPLREQYLQPVFSILFPEWTGKKLDSHKAFTVQYEQGKDTSLDYHYDNAEVTLNVCLGKDFEEGTLYFGKMRTEASSESHWTEVCHSVSHGIAHRGQHLHGAMPIQEGMRVNLIIWLRSSEVRNQQCPMCNSVPCLVEVSGFGDGFTRTCDGT